MPNVLAISSSVVPSWLVPLAAGVVLGLGAAVPPGPVNLEIARRTVRGGFWAGAAVGLGAVTVDVLFAILLGMGVLALVEAMPTLRLTITLVGLALLIFLGVSALRNFARHVAAARSPLSAVADNPPERAALQPTPLAGYSAGFVMCATSPYQVAWWLGAVPAVLASMAGGDLSRTGALLVCAGVFLGTLAWVVAFAGALHAVRALDRRRWLPSLMDLTGGIVLLGFAAATAWNLAARHL